MKTVCPWCGKLVRGGSEEAPNYRICEDCNKIFMDAFRDYYCGTERYRRRQYPEEFHDPAQDHLILLALLLSAVAVVLLTSVALNYVTDGWVPNLIQWAVDHPTK